MILRREVTVHRRISEIGRADWSACAAAANYAGNPFISFDFLDCLEASDCAVERTGWGPSHLLLRDAAGEAAAVMPLYLKSHSRGEYVFDHAWAEAYQRAGGAYYPKLQGCAPFSPVTGPRLLVRDGVAREEAQKTLLAGALTLCERTGASGVHVTFPTHDEWRLMGEQGLLQRQDQQYHWFNRGYGDFDDFLAALSSGRRKTIRRERRDALAAVEVVPLTGGDLKEEHWDAFFGFYMDTGARKWGRPYLTRAAFTLLGERMGDRIVLVMAEEEGRAVAGALNFLGPDALYGRYWGALVERPFLHFELCYYQAIDLAIERGLARVEAGAQGPHKLARGYEPVATTSAHYIAHPGFRAAVADFLERERAGVAADQLILGQHTPFRRDP